MTAIEAMEISVELWTWVVVTNGRKCDWPGWERYGEMDCDCALCQYTVYGCELCPMFGHWGGGYGSCVHDGTNYSKWDGTEGEEKQKWATVVRDSLIKRLAEMRGAVVGGAVVGGAV